MNGAETTARWEEFFGPEASDDDEAFLDSWAQFDLQQLADAFPHNEFADWDQAKVLPIAQGTWRGSGRRWR